MFRTCLFISPYLRILGPVQSTGGNCAAGKPRGGALLKWDGASSFVEDAVRKTFGYRLSVMPGTGVPWTVNGCGQLNGFSTLSGKPKLGQTAAGTTSFFDIVTVDGSLGEVVLPRF